MGFQFKQFTIEDHRCAQRVGTDGVLLGAWAPVQGDTVLDVGTGSGLISIMLAQRTQALITAIDIDRDSVQQATQNVLQCPWHDRIHVLQADFNDWTPPHAFDSIVSNPPFFEHALECPDARRNIARHATSLPLQALAKRSGELLNPMGRLSVILPYDTADSFIFNCQLASLYLYRRVDICTVSRKPPRRVLMCFIKGKVSSPSTQRLTLLSSSGLRTDEHQTLTADYYIK